MLAMFFRHQKKNFIFKKNHLHKNEHGASVLEAAIAIPLYFAIALTSFDLLRLTYNVLSLQFVSRTIMRQAMVGQIQANEFRSSLVDQAKRFGVRVNPEQIKICPLSRFATCSTPTISSGQEQTLHALQVSVPIEGILIGSFGKITKKNYSLQTLVLSNREPS
jgi:hypothetical protein